MAARSAPRQHAKGAHLSHSGYDVDVVDLIDVFASSNTIRDHGKGLATQVGQKRLLDEVSNISQALLVFRGAAEPWMNALLESTAGIVLLGTPHSGSNLANWASILTKFSSLVRPTNTPIVDVLRPGSEMLANLQQELHSMLDARQTQRRSVPRICCLFEELPYKGAVGHIVPRYSVILSRYGNQGVHADNVGMTRFTDRMDQSYQNVCSQLRIWALEIESDARLGYLLYAGSEELHIRRGDK
ncbi:MAG: hypothetical protein Q9185_004636 [Variospora sp. 1 TL-2023]